MPSKRPKIFKPSLKVSGDADRYDHRAGNDDNTQPEIFSAGWTPVGWHHYSLISLRQCKLCRNAFKSTNWFTSIKPTQNTEKALPRNWASTGSVHQFCRPDNEWIRGSPSEEGFSPIQPWFTSTTSNATIISGLGSYQRHQSRVAHRPSHPLLRVGLLIPTRLNGFISRSC